MSSVALTPEQISQYDESKQRAIVASLVTCLVLVNVSVAARGISQYYNFRRVYLDDVFVLTSGILVNALVANLLAAKYYGLGLHSWRVIAEDSHAPQRLSRAFEHVWIAMVIQPSCLSAIRICLLYFNHRLFVVQRQRWLLVAWWTNLGYEVLWWIGATGFYTFQCWPPPWYWLQFYSKLDQTPPGSITHGQCNAQTVVHVSLPLLFSLVSDVSILLIPVVALSQLQMTWKRKAAMAALFPVGLVFCILEVVRVIALWFGTDDKNDPSWGVTNFLILSVAAETTAILRACLPVMMPTILREAMALHDYLSMRIRCRHQRHSTAVHKSSKAYNHFVASSHHSDPTEQSHDTSHGFSRDALAIEKMQRAYLQQGAHETERSSEDNVVIRTDVAMTMEEGHLEDRDPFYMPYLGLSRTQLSENSDSRSSAPTG